MIFETPTDFNIEREYKNHTVKYYNMREIAQGSPEIGNVSINGKNLPLRYFFGGPPLFYEEYMLSPLYVKKFCKTGFVLCRINLKNLSMDFIGNLKDLIFLKEVDLPDKKVYYHRDVNGTTISAISLEE
ncbi:hypothetical protein [Ulvibacterium sp.]|uniref:hypothetical protein n=1 Tax=Ulvibacterium sp. TaxID=2665914 RepID=UPI003CC69AE7